MVSTVVLSFIYDYYITIETCHQRGMQFSRLSCAIDDLSYFVYMVVAKEKKVVTVRWSSPKLGQYLM